MWPRRKSRAGSDVTRVLESADNGLKTMIVNTGKKVSIDKLVYRQGISTRVGD